MAYFEAYTDADGQPVLLIVGEIARSEIINDLANLGKLIGPDEQAVVVNAQELMKWLGDNADIELTT
jgi:hypothetical protein